MISLIDAGVPAHKTWAGHLICESCWLIPFLVFPIYALSLSAGCCGNKKMNKHVTTLSKL